MSMETHKIQNTLKLRENANIDRRKRKDAPVVWAIIIICLVTFGYLVVYDERFKGDCVLSKVGDACHVRVGK